MQIITVPAGPLRANSYLLTENGRDAVLIDCGGSEALAQARRRGLRVAYVLLTHGHFDHVFGCAAAQEAGAKVGCSEAERAFLEAGPDLGLAMGLSVPPFTVDFTFRDGDVLDLCGMRFGVIASPGHTPGGICLLDRQDRLLFTGDSVIEQTWMQMDESLPMHVFLDSLESLGKIRSAFDYILTGHTRMCPEDASLCEAQRRAVTEVINGQDEGDMPYEWYGGLATAHPYGPEPRRIVYRRDRLEKERKETAK